MTGTTEIDSERRATMQDVAKRAGVSRTTASFVLNGRDDMRISSSAQERVRRAARELDYRPNLMARALTTRLTHTIALVSSGVSADPYSGDLIAGALAGAVEAGHMLYVGETGGDAELESQLVIDFTDRRVDGLLYATPSVRHVTPPRSSRGRTVLLNCLTVDRPVNSVVPDDYGAGRVAAEHLLVNGHDVGIWLVGETRDAVLSARDRRTGIVDVLREEGMELAGHVACAWWPESAREAVGSLLADGRRPSAMICLNDRIALGVYQAASHHGLTIPTDVSVVSFDDSVLASWLEPRLTSLALPHREMGRRAVELLLAGERAHIERLQMQLRIGRSVADRT